ncbi:MAG: pyruvate dehydrogenase complex dihydrolipoamide acetyltransferase [Acidobacteria bacterium]|nr:MAG: pyruvate dehydrogenase complex dihydrolipoamide acetyltransferase [Acidobacteriota bacterium]
MISKVVLAKLSPTMEEGTIVKWNKKEGDPVKQGDVLAEIETDKANMEMEAQGSGVLRKILVPAGGKAPVGSLIGVIADANEDISKMVASAATPAAAPAAPAPAPTQQPQQPPPQPQPPQQQAQPQPPPAAPQPSAPPAPAPQPAAAPVAAAPAPPAAGPRPVPAPAASEGGRVKASPLARSMAAHRNIPLDAVAGSGPGGRIIKRDIEAWSGAPTAARVAAPAAPPGPTGPAITPGQELPVSNMRKVIAKRLAESMFTAPHFYVTVEIDMDSAVALREQLQRGEDVKVTYNDLVVKACAKALTRFPMVNASWGGDKIATHGEVHVGVAVTIPDGLITPVVRNADRKSVVEISREVKDLAARARDRKLKPEEFTGSTFTISNLGMFGVTEFTAIINPPESAILAVGAVQNVPVVGEDGSLRAGHRMKVTLSSDHRVVDGAMAAQFLGEVRRLLENPVSLFV